MKAEYLFLKQEIEGKLNKTIRQKVKDWNLILPDPVLVQSSPLKLCGPEGWDSQRNISEETTTQTIE